MSTNNRVKIITTNSGCFDAAQLLAIVLFLMYQKGIIYEVVRASDKESNTRITRDSLDNIFHTSKYNIAKDYLKIALNRDVTREDDPLVEKFVYIVYRDLVRYYTEPQKHVFKRLLLPASAQTSREFTISDIVQYMNVDDTDSQAQEINFHKTLNIFHDWLDVYMRETAKDVIEISRMTPKNSLGSYHKD